MTAAFRPLAPWRPSRRRGWANRARSTSSVWTQRRVAAQHAERARDSSRPQDRGDPARARVLRPARVGDPGAGRPPGRRPARDGGLRPADLARVLSRLGDPHGARARARSRCSCSIRLSLAIDCQSMNAQLRPTSHAERPRLHAGPGPRPTGSRSRSSPRRSQWDAGETVFREGDRDSVLYVVEAGRVAIEMAVPGRGRVTILTVGPGEVFGWSSLFLRAAQDGRGPDDRADQGPGPRRRPAPRPLRRRPAARLRADATDPRGGLRAAEGHADAAPGYLRSLTPSRAATGRSPRTRTRRCRHPTGVAPLGQTVVLDKPDLGRIIDRLWQEGYTVVGPTIAQGAIIFDELRGLEQLPIGWTDEQEGGTYRLKRRDDGAYFGYAVGPHSWKKYLFPSRLTLFSIEPTADSFAVHPSPEPVPKYAFLGARSCDLHAIEIQDRRFLRGPLRRPALPGPARAGLHHRGELRPGRGHLLLHQHEDRPEGRRAASTWR